MVVKIKMTPVKNKYQNVTNDLYKLLFVFLKLL